MHNFLIRISDLFFSIIGLILLSPLFIVISVLIKLNSKGPIIFRQNRVGKSNKDFTLWKFRTMFIDSEKHGLITLDKNETRITSIGKILRKWKLDELPQLINVLNGEMSIVGPRPEVRRYVDMYNVEQQKVLLVKPGITDYASIEYVNENELLATSADPLRTYVDVIMPAKIELNMRYINNRKIGNYLKIIALTALKIVRSA